MSVLTNTMEKNYVGEVECGDGCQFKCGGQKNPL